MKKPDLIEQASKDFYNEVHEIRMKLPRKIKKKKLKHAPVSAHKRRSILSDICKKYALSYEFMAKMLKVEESYTYLEAFLEG